MYRVVGQCMRIEMINYDEITFMSRSDVKVQARDGVVRGVHWLAW